MSGIIIRMSLKFEQFIFIQIPFRTFSVTWLILSVNSKILPLIFSPAHNINVLSSVIILPLFFYRILCHVLTLYK